MMFLREDTLAKSRDSVSFLHGLDCLFPRFRTPSSTAQINVPFTTTLTHTRPDRTAVHEPSLFQIYGKTVRYRPYLIIFFLFFFSLFFSLSLLSSRAPFSIHTETAHFVTVPHRSARSAIGALDARICFFSSRSRRHKDAPQREVCTIFFLLCYSITGVECTIYSIQLALAKTLRPTKVLVESLGFKNWLSPKFPFPFRK